MSAWVYIGEKEKSLWNTVCIFFHVRDNGYQMGQGISRARILTNSQDVFELCLLRPMCSFHKPGFHKCLLFYSLHMDEGIECPHFGDFSGNS